MGRESKPPGAGGMRPPLPPRPSQRSQTSELSRAPRGGGCAKRSLNLAPSISLEPPSSTTRHVSHSRLAQRAERLPKPRIASCARCCFFPRVSVFFSAVFRSSSSPPSRAQFLRRSRSRARASRFLSETRRWRVPFAPPRIAVTFPSISPPHRPFAARNVGRVPQARQEPIPGRSFWAHCLRTQEIRGRFVERSPLPRGGASPFGEDPPPAPEGGGGRGCDSDDIARSKRSKANARPPPTAPGLSHEGLRMWARRQEVRPSREEGDDFQERQQRQRRQQQRRR